VTYVCWHTTLNAVEVGDHPGDWTVVNNVAFCQHQEPVDGCQNPVAGLVNGQENRSLPLSRHLREHLHDVQSRGAVQP
jgi:hypothetical protein